LLTSHLSLLAALRPSLELPGRPGAATPGRGARPDDARGCGAPELPRACPRARAVPGLGREGARWAAAPRQGRRIGRGSVLAGPQTGAARGYWAGRRAPS